MGFLPNPQTRYSFRLLHWFVLCLSEKVCILESFSHSYSNCLQSSGLSLIQDQRIGDLTLFSLPSTLPVTLLVLSPSSGVVRSKCREVDVIYVHIYSGGVRGRCLRPVPCGALGLPAGGGSARRLPHRGAPHGPWGEPLQGIQLSHHEPAREGAQRTCLQGKSLLRLWKIMLSITEECWSPLWNPHSMNLHYLYCLKYIELRTDCGYFYWDSNLWLARIPRVRPRKSVWGKSQEEKEI